MITRTYGRFNRPENPDNCVEPVNVRNSYDVKQCSRKRKKGNFCGTHFNKFVRYDHGDPSITVLVNSFGGVRNDRYRVLDAMSIGHTIYARAEGENRIEVSPCAECGGIELFEGHAAYECLCNRGATLNGNDVLSLLGGVDDWEGFVALAENLGDAYDMPRVGHQILNAIGPIVALNVNNVNTVNRDDLARAQMVLVRNFVRHG